MFVFSLVAKAKSLDFKLMGSLLFGGEWVGDSAKIRLDQLLLIEQHAQQQAQQLEPLETEARVRVDALVKRSDLNGSVGTVQSWNASVGRYRVFLDDGTKLALKPGCLSLSETGMRLAANNRVRRDNGDGGDGGSGDKISESIREGSTLEYVYDLGDYWHHTITVERVFSDSDNKADDLDRGGCDGTGNSRGVGAGGGGDSGGGDSSGGDSSGCGGGGGGAFEVLGGWGACPPEDQGGPSRHVERINRLLSVSEEKRRTQE